MSKKTLALIIGLVATTVILFVVALQTSQTLAPLITDEQQITDTPTGPAATTISMQPELLSLIATESGSLDIVIDSGDNEIAAVQLEIAYNPQSLTNIMLTPGTFIPNASTLLNLNDTKTGRISYALAIPPSGKTVSGNGIIARISFAKNPSALERTTNITILPKSIVTNTSSNVSILKEATGAKIILSTQTSTPSAIPSPGQ